MSFTIKQMNTDLIDTANEMDGFLFASVVFFSNVKRKQLK